MMKGHVKIELLDHKTGKIKTTEHENMLTGALAYRAGIDTLVIPEENRKDLEKIPSYVLDKFRIVPVREIREVLDTALKRD